MLVDSHCHLDFPDFSEERTAVVARARAAGVGRMVTISTRVRHFPQVLAIAEEFGDVFCSVGTHPHNAVEEPDVTAEELARVWDGALGQDTLDRFAAMNLPLPGQTPAPEAAS